jgi:alkylation response protein AidB-like acyl-CoA dehydrogenase
MDFWPTDDQLDLHTGMAAFLAGRLPLEEIAAREETAAVIDVDRWRELADMGVFSMRADGLGVRDAVLAFEALGQGLVPGPLVASHLAAGLIDGAADGSKIVGFFDPQPTGNVILHATQCNALLWFADDELRVVAPTALTLRAHTKPLDPLSPVWSATETEPPFEVIAQGDDVRDLRRVGVVLTSALQLGVALGAVQLANGYAHGREQFGRPIGSFQAVKHLLADMLVKAEVARSAVYAAACALDGASDLVGDPDVERAVSVAKLMAGEAALFNGKTGIQVHGGMGFTWEVHAQRFWKRAVVLDNEFESTEWHAAHIAEHLTLKRTMEGGR